MTRREWLTLPIGLVLAVMVLAVVYGIQVIGSPGHAAATGTTLYTRNTEQVAKTVTVDRDGKGLSGGDYQTFVETIEVTDAAGKPTGQTGNGRTVCTYVEAGKALCQAEFAFAGDGIELSGFLASGGKQTLAVTGGTGVYFGITGTATITGGTDPVTTFAITYTSAP